jgi:hypothetical protein
MTVQKRLKHCLASNIIGGDRDDSEELKKKKPDELIELHVMENIYFLNLTAHHHYTDNEQQAFNERKQWLAPPLKGSVYSYWATKYLLSHYLQNHITRCYDIKLVQARKTKGSLVKDSQMDQCKIRLKHLEKEKKEDQTNDKRSMQLSVKVLNLKWASYTTIQWKGGDYSQFMLWCGENAIIVNKIWVV